MDRRDGHHRECRELLESGTAVTMPAPTFGELDWLGRRRGIPEAGELLVESVIDGSVLRFDLDLEDWARVRMLLVQYRDLPLNLVDASIVAVAERLEEQAIATLDREHFSVVRPRHVPAFTLVP